MDTAAAAHFVNGLAFYPGWSLEAEDFSHRFQGTITVRITITDGRNSDQDQAPDYATPVPPAGPRATFPVYVGDVTGHDDLVARVIDAAVENFTHEVREFTRYLTPEGEWHAPFHPHNRDGIAAWSERTGRDTDLDYRFGLA